MAADKSKEVVPAERMDLAQIAGGMLRSSEDAALDIARQVLNATNADDLFAEKSSLGIEDLAGQMIRVKDATLREGDGSYDSPLAQYAVADIDVRDGGAWSPGTLVTGATNVVLQLVKAKQLGVLPIVVTVREIKTSRNFTTYRLVKADADF